MYRSTAALAVLVLLPLAGRAQESTTPRTHTVAPGETLWEVARIHLGDGHAWPSILEANRELLDDPDRIRAGMVLTLPAAGVPAGVARTVERGDSAVILVESGTGPRDVDPNARTVFWRPASDAASPRLSSAYGVEDVPSVRRRELGVGGQAGGARGRAVPDPQDGPPPVSEDVRWSAPWPVEAGSRSEEPLRVAAIGESAFRSTTRAHEIVRLEGSSEAAWPVGTRLRTFRLGRSPAGVLATPTAVLSVTGSEPGVVTAEVTRLYAPLRVGDRVEPLPDVSAGPGSGRGGEEPVIVRLLRPAVVQGFGDLVFLGPGSDLAVGDVLVPEDEGGQGAAGPRLQVVAFGPGGATARILDPVARGLHPGMTLHPYSARP